MSHTYYVVVAHFTLKKQEERQLKKKGDKRHDGILTATLQKRLQETTTKNK
jgi:hypothetical protein